MLLMGTASSLSQAVCVKCPGVSLSQRLISTAMHYIGTLKVSLLWGVHALIIEVPLYTHAHTHTELPHMSIYNDLKDKLLTLDWHHSTSKRTAGCRTMLKLKACSQGLSCSTWIPFCRFTGSMSYGGRGRGGGKERVGEIKAEGR